MLSYSEPAEQMDMERLIRLVSSKRPLWDRKDNSHHNRYVLDRLWDEIANEMGISRDTARTKWKSLRDSFRKELKKSPEERNRSIWQYWTNLRFLEDQFPLHNNRSFDFVSVGCESLPGDDDSLDMGEYNQDENTQFAEPSKKFLEVFLGENQDGLDDKNQIRNNTNVTGMKRVLEDHERIQNHQKNFKCASDLDEDRYFFGSLVPHVQKLTPKRKMLLRIKIQELIYKFVYEDETDVLS